MTQVTKVWATQDYLHTLIDAIVGLNAWNVELGFPARRDDRHIWVDDDIADWVREDRTSNFRGQEESFSLAVFLYSRLTGSTYKEQRDEVAAAAALIEAAIAADPTFNALLMSARVTGGEFAGAWADAEGKQRVGVLRLTISCKGWLA